MDTKLSILDGLIKLLLSGNKDKKDIRFLERRLKRYKRKWSKDGLDKEEKAKLKQLEVLIQEKLLNL
tara:strand:+ start:3638 stop:3838 length:201 start_codon:yes stop_codon:yes gene_type:complete